MRKVLGQEAVMNIMSEKKRKWKNKLETTSEDRLVKKVCTWRKQGV